MTVLEVELFTDPACPFAFSAEPVRQRLRFHYGVHLRWTTRMIVLTREPGEADKLAEGARAYNAATACRSTRTPTPRPASSEPACRAVVAARLHAPERVEALLRHLRVRVMQRGLLDDSALTDAAATDADLDPVDLVAWSATDKVAAALEAEAAAARDPAPAARALDHKLGGPPQHRRYTAPTYLIAGQAVPGFNPIETYETTVANLAPELPRRPKPESVTELLEWAEEPLATAEIALIMQLDLDDTREALSKVARFLPAGADGYWSSPDTDR